MLINKKTIDRISTFLTSIIMEYKEWTLVKGLDLKTDKNIGTHVELAPKTCQQSTLLHNTTETSLCVHPKIHIKTNLGEAVLGDEYLTKVSLHQSSLSLFFPNWAPLLYHTVPFRRFLLHRTRLLCEVLKNSMVTWTQPTSCLIHSHNLFLPPPLMSQSSSHTKTNTDTLFVFFLPNSCDISFQGLIFLYISLNPLLSISWVINFLDYSIQRLKLLLPKTTKITNLEVYW